MEIILRGDLPGHSQDVKTSTLHLIAYQEYSY